MRYIMLNEIFTKTITKQEKGELYFQYTQNIFHRESCMQKGKIE